MTDYATAQMKASIVTQRVSDYATDSKEGFGAVKVVLTGIIGAIFGACILAVYLPINKPMGAVTIAELECTICHKQAKPLSYRQYREKHGNPIKRKQARVSNDDACILSMLTEDSK